MHYTIENDTNSNFGLFSSYVITWEGMDPA